MAIQPGAPIQPVVPKTAHVPTGNPLAKHFRQPSVYIKLPSEGVWYDESIITIPESGEVPVYPMTALDEITYRTADALFNGQAVTDVIKSCIPAFKDPARISTLDLDTVLIAIRLATFGHEMEFTSKCPECEESNDLALDLRQIMEKVKKPDFGSPLSFGDIEIHFKPLTYKEQNDNNMAQFEDQKTMESLPDMEMSEEEKLKILQKAFANISKLTLVALADSISMIQSGDDVVVDRGHIAEYLENCPSQQFEKIREKIAEIRESGEMDPLHIVCNDCKHEYNTPFTMNVANFFASGS